MSTYRFYTVPDEVIVTRDLGRPDSEPTASIAFTTSMPSTTSPKTTCLPSSHDVTTVVMKNCEKERGRGDDQRMLFSGVGDVLLTWEPFVLGPAFAMESRPGLVCRSLKFSSE